MSLLTILDDVSIAVLQVYVFAKLMLFRRLCVGGRNILMDPDQYLFTGSTTIKPVYIDTDDNSSGGGNRPMLSIEVVIYIHFEVQLSNSYSECVVYIDEIDTDGDEPNPVDFAVKMCGYL